MPSRNTKSSPIRANEYEAFVKPESSVNTFIKPSTHFETKEWNYSNQLKIVLCLNLGHLLIGYSVGWSAPVIPKLQNLEESPLGRVITDTEASWVATIFGPINFIVVNIAGFLANLFGRKPYLIFSSIMMCFGYILIVMASNISMIYLGRIFVGFGFGPISVINLIYIGEIASPNIRGTIIAVTGVVHVLGSLLVYSVGPFVSFAGVGHIAIAICVVYITCGFYIPESPVYYIMKGNIEAAKTTLQRLERSKDIETELEIMIADQKDRNSSISRSWREMFTEKVNRKSLGITATLFILQEGCGALTIIFFATSIFQSANSSIAPHIGTIILGVVQLGGVLCTPFLIERSGRKGLLLISTSLCGLTLLALGAYFYLDFIKQGAVANSLRWLPLVLLITFLLGYNSGLSIVPNTLLGEMFTPTVRSTGSSFAFTLGILSCFATNLAFGYLSSFGKYITFWTLAGVNFIAFVFTAVCVPETKGKTLTEIQHMLAR